MKIIINNFLVLFFLMIICSCQENEQQVYSDFARIKFGDEVAEVRRSFVARKMDVTRDTVFIEVNTIGRLSDTPRRVKLIQIHEQAVEYIRDDKNNIIDSVFTDVPFQAVPGVHYIPLDDIEMMDTLSIIPANSNKGQIGIIILRDESLKTNEYRLCLRLAENDEFKLGPKDNLACKLVFSDKLIKPADKYWNACRQWFGTYSVKKHHFMNVTLETDVNDEWFLDIMTDISIIQNYQVVLNAILDEFNRNPENIASGAAPMREIDGDPKSPLIKFGY